jgi:zinc transporter ZupT
MLDVNGWTVFWAALITALATGLGALPFFLVRSFPSRWLGIFNAAAAGLMLGASHSLINEALGISFPQLLTGLVIGVLAIQFGYNRLADDHHHMVDMLRSTGGMKAMMIVGVMTLHSFAEGVGVGVSFAGSQGLGQFITAAIAVHNIPEGLAISLVLVPRGTSPLKAGLWSIFSSLPQPLMAVPAFLFVTVFSQFLPAGLGLAAGAMLWMAFAELIPDAMHEISSHTTATVVALSFAAMIGFQALL